MSEPRNVITWDELAEGEASNELARKIEESMPRAAADGKRLEIEGRGGPHGGKDSQIFTRTIDPSSQPPTPVNLVLEGIINEYRSGLDDDWTGRIRINLREKGNTRNVYTSYSRNIAPAEYEDEGDFDDEGVFDDEPDQLPQGHPGRIPHIPVQQQRPGPYQQQHYQGNWQTPQGMPAVDMQGTGHIGPSAYERRRMNAREVGLNEPLSEFLMAPQWASVVDMLGGHNDRLMRMNLDLAGSIKDMHMRAMDMSENIVMRVLDNNAPQPQVFQREGDSGGGRDMLGAGIKLMKMLKKSGDPSQPPAPAPTPAWGGTPSAAPSTGDRAGDWQKGALNIPEADPSEWGDDLDDEDDFDVDPTPAPRPKPLPAGGGAAAPLPHKAPAGLLTADELSQQVKGLAKQDPAAVKSMVMGMKNELAEALGLDQDMLDAFLDD